MFKRTQTLCFSYFYLSPGKPGFKIYFKISVT
ncbi:hypothetical protein HDC90_004180 [Pedobacter sp. AK013]|nr:hypothetical protein [Pedobacter sp. AK013]